MNGGVDVLICIQSEILLCWVYPWLLVVSDPSSFMCRMCSSDQLGSCSWIHCVGLVLFCATCHLSAGLSWPVVCVQPSRSVCPPNSHISVYGWKTLSVWENSSFKCFVLWCQFLLLVSNKLLCLLDNTYILTYDHYYNLRVTYKLL